MKEMEAKEAKYRENWLVRQSMLHRLRQHRLVLKYLKVNGGREWVSVQTQYFDSSWVKLVTSPSRHGLLLLPGSPHPLGVDV